MHFNIDQNDVKANAAKPARLTKSLSFVSTYGLRRSKSMNAADVMPNILNDPELGEFPPTIRDTLSKAVKGNNNYWKQFHILRNKKKTLINLSKFRYYLIITFVLLRPKSINCSCSDGTRAKYFGESRREQKLRWTSSENLHHYYRGNYTMNYNLTLKCTQ